MKKLLGIVVLGLLLSGNAYANKNENIKIDLIFCESNGGNKEVYLKDTFDGSCPPSQPIEITYKKFKKKYGWQIGKQLCYAPYEKKLERVFLTPGGACHRATRIIAIKIKRKGGDYYYYGNKENEKKKREELADKKKKEEEKKIAEKEKQKPKPGPDENEKISGKQGTAFFIDNNGHMITNHHVIDGCKDKSQISYKNENIKAKLIAKDNLLDLALLKADVKNSNFINISTTPPKKLKRVIVAGYPLGLELSNDLKFNSGIITSLKGLGDDSTRIQIDAAVNKGNSGGPIVYEENGDLAAVAVSGLSKDKTEAINFGIKASSVENFLQSNQIDLTLVKQKFNFTNDDLAELLESSTVYTFCEY